LNQLAGKVQVSVQYAITVAITDDQDVWGHKYLFLNGTCRP
jgi:hypothetical protein